MKKLSAVIVTVLMLASLTACNNKPSQVPPSAEIIPESASESISEPNSDESADIQKSEGDSATSDTESVPTESNTESVPTESNTESVSTESNTESVPTESITDSDNSSLENKPVTSKTLPLKEYPVGSYFTKNGMPCDDHDSCDWSVDNCNCINFDRSIQSMGFAKYVYFTVTGKHVNDNKIGVDADLTSQTANLELANLPEGAYIAVTQKNGVPFQMAKISSDDNGITVYGANYGGGCKVSVLTFTWEQFAEKFPHLDCIAK